MSQDAQEAEDQKPEDIASLWEQVSAERAKPLEAAADDPPAEDPPADPEPQPEVKSEVDPQKAVADALASFGDKTNATLEAFGGKVSEALKQVRAEATVAKEIPDGPSAKEIAEARKSPEKWERLRGENPEWAEAIDEVVDYKLQAAKAAEPKLDLKKLREELKAEVLAEIPQVAQRTYLESRQTEQRQVESITEVEAAHPAFRETVKSAEFLEWKDKQSPGIKALYDSPHPSDAIQMLNLYVGSKPTEKPTKSADEVAAERRSRVAASAMPRGQTQPVARVSAETVTTEQLWAIESKRREAARRAA